MAGGRSGNAHPFQRNISVYDPRLPRRDRVPDRRTVRHRFQNSGSLIQIYEPLSKLRCDNIFLQLVILLGKLMTQGGKGRAEA